MEVTLIRQILKRAKRWSIIADDVANLPENQSAVGRALTLEHKLLLFRTAASKPEWEVAYCAGVIAVNTTCRKVELLNLHWSDVDLFGRVLPIRRSKTEAGHRTIPLNNEAVAAFARLRRRAEAFGGGASDISSFQRAKTASSISRGISGRSVPRGGVWYGKPECVPDAMQPAPSCKRADGSAGPRPHGSERRKPSGASDS